MAETTSETIPNVATVTTSTIASSSMFSTTLEEHLYGGPSVSMGYQALNGTYSGVSSNSWNSPMSSFGIISS